MKRRTSAIWTVPTEDFQNILDNSDTMKEVVEKLGYKSSSQGAHYRRIKERIENDGLDTTKFDENRKKWRKEFNESVYSKRARPIEEYFIENSTVERQAVKREIVKRNLIEYKCSKCDITDTWNGEPISLHLDHINGINNDNRLENLRFLCPNCHSQTSTYAGKALTKYKCTCGKKKTAGSRFCRECADYSVDKPSTRKFDPTIEELKDVLHRLDYNMCAVGKHYGVSDNAIRKRCRKLEIDWKQCSVSESNRS
jgi:Zn finger protein HypA/HybF involved in hydrogenase expression